jgi:hypothetical protein
MKSYLDQTVCNYVAYCSRDCRFNSGGMLVQISLFWVKMKMTVNFDFIIIYKTFLPI